MTARLLAALFFCLLLASPASAERRRPEGQGDKLEVAPPAEAFQFQADSEGRRRAETWLDQGRGLYKHGEFEEAHAAFTRAAQAEPENPVAWYNLGLAGLKTERYSEAAWAFDQANALKPADHYQYHTGVALMQGGEIHRAMDQFSALLARLPNHAQSWKALGYCYESLGQDVRAAECFSKAQKGLALDTGLAAKIAHRPAPRLLPEALERKTLSAADATERLETSKRGDAAIPQEHAATVLAMADKAATAKARPPQLPVANILNEQVYGKLLPSGQELVELTRSYDCGRDRNDAPPAPSEVAPTPEAELAPIPARPAEAPEKTVPPPAVAAPAGDRADL